VGTMVLSPQLFASSQDPDEIGLAVSRVLSSTPLCSLASVSLDGKAHINTAYYAIDEKFTVYILTSPQSVHAVTWEHNSSVAIAITDSGQPWGKPHRGLQIFGEAHRIPDDQHSRVFALYAATHPRLRDLASDANTLLALHTLRFYSITLNRIKIVDEIALGEDAISVPINHESRSAATTETEEDLA
jgi:uncharacterized protein YhbP (UPF0306 family)